MYATLPFTHLALGKPRELVQAVLRQPLSELALRMRIS